MCARAAAICDLAVVVVRPLAISITSLTWAAVVERRAPVLAQVGHWQAALWQAGPPPRSCMIVRLRFLREDVQALAT
jgi:hypothetical protein